MTSWRGGYNEILARTISGGSKGAATFPHDLWEVYEAIQSTGLVQVSDGAGRQYGLLVADDPGADTGT